jgi:hypothetical protein
LYVMDRTVRFRVHSPMPIVEELRDYPRPVGHRKEQIDQALDIASAANKVFVEAGAHIGEEQWHWQVASADALKQNLTPHLKILTYEEVQLVSRLLDTEGKHEISFSRFCLFIGMATKHRFQRKDSMFTVVQSFREIYGAAK